MWLALAVGEMMAEGSVGWKAGVLGSSVVEFGRILGTVE